MAGNIVRPAGGSAGARDRGSLRVILPLLALFMVLVVAAVLLARSCGVATEDTREGPSGGPAVAPHVRNIQEAPQASLLTILVSEDSGERLYYMVSSQGMAEQFGAITAAIAGAKPVDEQVDGSFSCLAVASFDNKDTLELSMSLERNRLAMGDSVYEPGADLKALVGDVQRRYAQQ